VAAATHASTGAAATVVDVDSSAPASHAASKLLAGASSDSGASPTSDDGRLQLAIQMSLREH
jgi:hypothetical protein